MFSSNNLAAFNNGGVRKQLFPRLRHNVGAMEGQDLEQRRASLSLSRLHLRLRFPVEEGVLVRKDRHAAQARARKLRRHRHRLLRTYAFAS